MKPTKLNVGAYQFDINTPKFLKEAVENCTNGMYPICWNIFRNLLAMVSVRASELDDPVLNILMLRLNLYDIDDGKEGQNISARPSRRNEVIKKIIEENNLQNHNT